jgi:FkbM family methyltransferase
MELNQNPHFKSLKYNLVEGLPDIYITPFSERIGHTWVNGVVWDKPLIEKFYSILESHNNHFVVIDLGAQTGSFSLLAKYFPNSNWYAFEPIEEACNALKTNLFLNNINNVVVYQMAASNSSGWTTLKMPNIGAWGLSTIGSNVLRFTPINERKIQCIDLDSFVFNNHIEKVHFMKLDTEGWELYILKGAKNLIIRDRPIILMEYNETNMKQCDVLKEDIKNFLQAANYEWELISNEDILCTPIK